VNYFLKFIGAKLHPESRLCGWDFSLYLSSEDMQDSHQRKNILHWKQKRPAEASLSLT